MTNVSALSSIVAVIFDQVGLFSKYKIISGNLTVTLEDTPIVPLTQSTVPACGSIPTPGLS
jgi:hypothetical protein